MSGHLKIVGAPKPPRKRGRRRPPLLTEQQERAARACIRNLIRTRYGSQVKMSEALGFCGDTLVNALRRRGSVSAELLVRISLACSIPLDQILTPGPRSVAA